MTTFRPVSRKETVRLIRLAQKGGQPGREALQLLIEQNIGLIKSVAYRYLTYGLPAHVELDDLIAEGMLGLANAVRKFQPRRNTQFSTYAVWWICSKIQRFIETQGTIRLSAHMATRAKKLRRVAAQFELAHGRPPGRDELIAASGLPRHKALAALDIPSAAYSLDELPNLGNGQIDNRANVVPDLAQAEALEDIVARLDRHRLRQFLWEVLPSRYATVIMLQAGLTADQAEPLNRKEIARRLGISTDEVARRSRAAQAVLTDPRYAPQLRQLLE